MRRTRAVLTALGCIVFLICPVTGARAQTQLFTVTDFAFEDGSALPDVHIAYETRGTLSPAHDNAIVLVPGAAADRHAFDPLIGPGKLFDTNRYFVISVDPLGGGESTSPADGMGQEFPRYTIRDMMELQQALVTRGLGIARVRAVIGQSMGSFIALEWGIHHPETIGGLVLMAPSPKADPAFRLTIDLITGSIALDPEWQGGHYSHNPVEGLRHAGMLFYPWVVSGAYIDRIGSEAAAREIETSAATYAAWDANALMLRMAAYHAHDVSAPFEGDMTAALARVKAPTLILTCSSDRLVGLGGATRIIAGVPRATYEEIASDLGHRALRATPGTTEGDKIADFIGRFLATLGPVTGH
ncbi:MAG: alpha/beta fold hydrolase [Alphaproteobacteria bacterium]|nr:alpha/beta fold hydrolase [Alphaproteobacteria bacterium]